MTMMRAVLKEMADEDFGDRTMKLRFVCVWWWWW